MPDSLRRATLAVAIILPALFVFYIRGPRRALTDSADFATVYAASRCWMFHANPYLQSDVERHYNLGHGDLEHTPNPYNGTSVYPPSTFPFVATVAWLDWDRARQLWLGINLIAFAASLACLARSELIPNWEVGIALIALLLLFSPVPSGLAKGQPSVLCISLLVCAFYLPRSRRSDLVSGLLLGVSCCIKPNIGLPYLLFCGWRRQWRTVATSIAVVSAVSIVAVTSLQSFSPGWVPSWLSNLRSAGAPGGSMDPTIADNISYLLVNFQALVGFFTLNQKLCNAITYALLGALAIWVIRVSKPRTDHWLLLGLLSLLVLMGSYHRYYDLQLLLLGTNAVLQIFYRKQWQPWLWATLAVPSLLLWVPLQALAGNNMATPKVDAPAPFLQMVWQFLAFRNQPICLSILTVTFAWAILRKSRPATPEMLHEPVQAGVTRTGEL
jgi:Glycosyltransferase family 87